MDYGVKITGITTHIIDEQIDRGIILCQKAIPIEPEDTFDALEEKFTHLAPEILRETVIIAGKQK
jgi:phosphoribosylglycinamide formyltransferase-1